MLLSRDVVGQVVDLGLRVDHFYKPAHQHIYAAMLDLMAADTGVDTVTVADELRRAGLLEDCGGTQYLLELQAATPAISNAARYAKIVKDTATLRRLIAVAGDITEIAYLEPDDPGAAVFQAGELLAQMDPTLAAVLSTLDTTDIAALLAGDLEPERPTLLTRTDGAALFYPGKVHGFQAEPSAGKSMIACAAVCEVLALGGSAGYLDYEDMPAGILGRLLAQGAQADALAERFYYTRPLGRFGPAEQIELQRAIDRYNFDLVIIDGVGESLSRQGLSEDKADDVVRWYDMLPRMIARTGAAVLVLDHVAKDPENRGRWARGSGAKLGAIDGATYQVKVRQAFSRHRAGRVELVVAKDRPGGVGAIGETVASIKIEPYGGGERIVITIDPHNTDVAPSDSWKPTVIMGKVWTALNESASPLTATGVAALVHSDKPRLVKEAIARLLAEGFIAETGRRPKTLRVVKPYDGAPVTSAPAWRGEPPAELAYDDGPTPDELAEIDSQRDLSDDYWR